MGHCMELEKEKWENFIFPNELLASVVTYASHMIMNFSHININAILRKIFQLFFKKHYMHTCYSPINPSRKPFFLYIMSNRNVLIKTLITVHYILTHCQKFPLHH